MGDEEFHDGRLVHIYKFVLKNAGFDEVRKAIEALAPYEMVVEAGPNNYLDPTPDIENKKTTVKDAMNILQYVVGTRELDTAELAKYDINSDGKISVKDAAEILRIIAY